MLIRPLIIAIICLCLATQVCGQIKVTSGRKTKTLKNNKVIGIVYRDTLFSTQEFNWYSLVSVNRNNIDTSIIFKEKEGITATITPDTIYTTAFKYMSSIDSTFTKTVRKYDNTVRGGRFYTKKELIPVVVPRYNDTIFKFYKPEIKSIYTKRWDAPFGNSMIIGIGGLITTGFFVATIVNLIKGDKENLKPTGFFTVGSAGFTSYFILQLKWHKSYDMKTSTWTIQ